MGASSWRYFTPYQEDIQEALEELRQREFQEGRYYKPGANLPATFEDWAKQMNLPPDQLAQFKEGFNQLKAMGQMTPASIEELLELNEEAGTHSILDIFDIGTSTEEDQSGTISKEDLFRIFGTDKPYHQKVEEKADALLEFRGRGFCTYIIVYKDGRPDELFFTGYSGD
ncbi:hypothetical protein HRG84_24125 [Flavisolibacter sp. BT320]|nr:hypothetical protein [Flavisolibacter longurius]